MLKLMLFLVGILYSLSSTEGDEDTGIVCETICRYLDYAKDAECTDRGLDIIPTSGCRGAYNFDITFNNLTHLAADAFQGFFRLRWLHLEENQIVTIEEGAFLPVRRNLQMLNVSRNQINELVDGTFVNMTQLEFLLLSDNQISYISPGAFRGLKRLSKLYLGNNRISTLDSTIFNEMPRLTELNLRNNNMQIFDISFLDVLPLMRKVFVHRNALTEITGSLSTHHNGLILLNFSSNNISTFDCTTLQNLDHLQNVYLGSNSLQTINNCHNQIQLSVLRMSDNPFHCDCQLRALQQWLQQHPESPSPVCTTPEEVRSMEVRNLELDCPENDDLIGTTYPDLIDGFHEEGTTSHLDLPKHPEILTSTRKSLDTPKIENPRLLTTLMRVNQISAVPGKDQLKNENGFFNMGDTIMHDPTLLAVLVAIVVVFIIVVFLLMVVLKNYCKPQPTYDYWSNKNYQNDADIEDGNVAIENNSHHYEKIKDKGRQTAALMHRQLSIDTDTSETNMLPQTPDSGVFPCNNSMCGSDESSCNCIRCHSPDSRDSHISHQDNYKNSVFFGQQEEIYSSSLSSYPYSQYSCPGSDICRCQSYHSGLSPTLPPLQTVGDTSPYIAHSKV